MSHAARALRPRCSGDRACPLLSGDPEPRCTQLQDRGRHTAPGTRPCDSFKWGPSASRIRGLHRDWLALSCIRPAGLLQGGASLAPPLGPSCPQTGGGGAATFSGGVGTCPNLVVWFWVSQEKRVRVPCPVSTIFCSHGHTWAEFRGKTWTGHRRSLLDDSGSAERAAGRRGQQRAQAMARAWGPGRPCAGPARETHGLLCHRWAHSSLRRPGTGGSSGLGPEAPGLSWVRWPGRATRPQTRLRAHSSWRFSRIHSFTHPLSPCSINSRRPSVRACPLALTPGLARRDDA